jgi:hypothetical protein
MRRLTAVWLLASFSVYISNGVNISSRDSVPASLIPITVLLDNTVMLDRFAEEEYRRFPDHYWLIETPRGTASLFPIATGLLAVPIYIFPVFLLHWDQKLSPERWRDIAVEVYQKPTAALFAALAVGVFWSICARLGFSLFLSVPLTVLFAFGSQTFATSSQGLWQHGPGSLAVLASIRCFLELDRRPVPAALLLSLFAGLAFAIRPNNLVLVAPLLLGALYHQTRLSLYLVLPGLMLVVPVVAYNAVVLGNFLGGYGLQMGGLSIQNMPTGLMGSFLSPARGLFIYFPAALLALVLAFVSPASWRRPLGLLLGTGVVLLAFLNSMWWDWGGGHCFGPRFFTEAQGPISYFSG